MPYLLLILIGYLRGSVKMEICHDIIFIKSNSKVLVYNYKLNKVCIINKSLYNFFKDDDNIGLNKNINFKDYELLLKNGIIIDNKLEYDKLAFSRKLSKKNKSVKLNSVYLHVTQRCNLSCSYCYNRKNLNQLDVLSTDDISHIADSLKNIGVSNIIITGGEALLRDDIVGICEIFKNLKFNLSLLTNGTLISKKQSILNLLDKVIISIDTFNQMKNMRNGLNVLKLKEELLSINDSQRSKISLRSVVTHSDEESWKDIKSFAISNGFKFLSSIFIPNDISEISLMPDVCKIEVNESYSSLSNPICGACYNEIAVDFNGDIYPCQSLIKPQFKISNILNCNWQEDLKNSHITEMFLNRTVDTVEHCSSCEYRYLCGGGCPAIPYNLYGSLCTCATPMCTYHKANIENKLKGVVKKYE